MSPTVLLVSADDRLASEVVRFAAAAGVTPSVVGSVTDALRSWAGAAVVLLGADQAGSVALLDPPRREGVHVVVPGSAGDASYRVALECGATSVVGLPEDADRLVALLTDAADGAVSAAVTIGVVGGAGGVGATVFACALARVCAERASTVLVDADPLGAGVDEVLGLPAGSGVRWDGVLASTGRLGARALREALPERGGLAVLAWPWDRPERVDPYAVREVLSAVHRGFAVAVVDLPRYPHPLADDLLPRCDRVVLVSTLTVPALASAARVAAALDAPARLVLRTAPGGVDAAEAARFLGPDVAAVMPAQRGLDEVLSLGVGPGSGRRGPLRAAATAVAAEILGPQI
ncbi:septum site-determining protein Ssd [Marmoricola sp. RAF53]|uniref:septum site-determining protein Ssd n=1 Tax=Marmoricola sp. RAF53 TaxID=3233059 RepID=UPI003F9BFFF8